MPSSDDRRTLLLSIDFEDWHQLVRRRVGAIEWQRPGPALRRQTERLLLLLDELGVRATFFILGMAARAHPELVEPIAAAGHEIGSHGDDHQLVSSQTPHEFAADLRRSRATIEELTGRQPVGYRAPAFSITRDTPWAYDVVAQEGFGYDASLHDTPTLRDRVVSTRLEPHPLPLKDGVLWEFPIAVWRTRGVNLPVGGASYWAAVPTSVVLKGLEETPSMAGLYLHPYEVDPQRLRPELSAAASNSQRGHAALRAAQRNFARRRATEVLRAIAGRYRLIPYGEAYAELSRGAATGP